MGLETTKGVLEFKFHYNIMQRQFAFTKLFHVYQTNVILKFYAYLQFIGIKSN